VREKPIMARHQRMPPEEAGYTYAVEPAATNRLLANEEESIYRNSYISGSQITFSMSSGLKSHLTLISNAAVSGLFKAPC